MVFEIHAGETVAGKTFHCKRGLNGSGAPAIVRADMSWFNSKRNKEAERFYLLPGQGGAAYRRKQVFILKWSIVVGLIVSVALGSVMYYLNRPHP